MHSRRINTVSDLFFQYGDTISSKRVNRQLSSSLQQIQDTCIVNGLFPHRFRNDVVLQGGACFIQSQLFFIKTIKIDKETFKQKYGSECYLYLELSEDKKQVRYTFYHEAVDQTHSRLFLALWKNEQFYYKVPEIDLIRREITLFIDEHTLYKFTNEKRIVANNLPSVKAEPSNLPTYAPELHYDIFLNGIQLNPLLDFVVKDGYIQFEVPANGVLRVFTYDKIPDST